MSTAETPSISQALGKGRWILIGLAVCVLLGILMSLLTSPADHAPGSIHNSRASGTMALAQVLEQEGTPVKDIYRWEDTRQLSSNDAVVVVNPNALTEKTLRDLLDSHTNVVFLGTYLQNERFVPYVRATSDSSGTALSADCDFPPALAAREISSARGALAATKEPLQSCFPLTPQSYAFLQFQRLDGTTVSFLSTPDIAYNQNITQAGNAAFLLQLLSPFEQLGWLLGGTFQQSDPSNEDTAAVFPASWVSALIVFFAALLVFTLATGRRLGPVISEELPVIVPGAETVLGRARLYRKARDYDACAYSARRYAARRLGTALHLPTPASRQDLLAGVAQYCDWPLPQIEQVLFGSNPETAKQLQALLEDLETLTKKVSNQER